MVGRHKLLIFIPAIILIPILLGMTPLNFVHNFSGGCPAAQSKELRCNACPFNSIISQDNHTIIGLPSTPLIEEATPSFYIHISNNQSILTNPFQTVPLRC
jgi:hypothetical protein